MVALCIEIRKIGVGIIVPSAGIGYGTAPIAKMNQILHVSPKSLAGIIVDQIHLNSSSHKHIG